jgi:hypothetical protein
MAAIVAVSHYVAPALQVTTYLLNVTWKAKRRIALALQQAVQALQQHQQQLIIAFALQCGISASNNIFFLL